jgi:hypothetical protein
LKPVVTDADTPKLNANRLSTVTTRQTSSSRSATARMKMTKNRVTVEFDSEELAADFAQSVRATGEVILEVGDCGLEVVCAAEVVEGKE